MAVKGFLPDKRAFLRILPGSELIVGLVDKGKNFRDSGEQFCWYFLSHRHLSENFEQIRILDDIDPDLAGGRKDLPRQRPLSARNDPGSTPRIVVIVQGNSLITLVLFLPQPVVSLCSSDARIEHRPSLW